MNKFGFKSSLQIFILDFFLLNLSFFICNYFRQGSMLLSLRSAKLLLLFYLCWIITCFAARKLKTSWYLTYRTGMITLFKATLYMGYCVVFIIVILGLQDFSRLQIFFTCLLSLLLEIIVWSILFRIAQNRYPKRVSLSVEIPRFTTAGSKSSFFQFGMDLIFVFIAFFTVNFLKRGTLVLLPTYDLLLLIIIGLWASTAFITGKFKKNKQQGFYFSLWQWLKAGVFMLAMISVIVFGFRLFEFSRFQGFAPIVLLMLIEAVFLKFYYLWYENKNSRDIESVEEVRQLQNQENLHIDTDIDKLREKLLEPLRDKLQAKLSPDNDSFFEFIDEHIDLNKILCLETTSEHNSTKFSLTSDRIPIRMFLSLDKINNIRRLNQYFLETHKMLIPGGYYFGYAHTISTHREWIYSKFSKEIARYIYAIDFCFTRIMPKLPGFQKIYFAMTKGKNRVISRAEVLGRLCFCGFKIIAEKNLEKKFCFIVQKVKTPAIDKSPTYGPLVTLKRVGYNNDIMPTYKFRTMHPYSEYLQNYVVETQGLQKGGKLDNDFRLTRWGILMRKLWIDELPMLYNWIKGDLQLVGVRPLSVQYFNMYDKELKKMRKNVKPGLVPPFYADMPETFEEICESEKIYIKAFLKSPFKTQWSYFWRAFINIVFKGARSK